MPRPQSAAQQARNALGAVVRRGEDPERIKQARRDLKAATMADWIERKLAEAPPLSEAQLADLRAKLAPAERGNDAA